MRFYQDYFESWAVQKTARFLGTKYPDAQTLLLYGNYSQHIALPTLFQSQG